MTKRPLFDVLCAQFPFISERKFRIRSTLTLSFLGAMFGIYFWVESEFGVTTTTVPLAEAISPDHLWRATVTETDEEGFVSDVTADVTLRALNNPSTKVRVLVVDTGGNKDETPRIAWVTSKLLRVNLYGLKFATVNMTDYAGIHFDIETDPSAPAAITAFRNSPGK